MKRVLLTSSGLENKRVEERFLALLGKAPAQTQALFLPTAATDAGAISVLPKCMNDLLNLGVPAENVTVFDLHRALSYRELCAFDLIYVTGGDPAYLLDRINDSGFRAPLQQYVTERGVYLGVSAGSVVAVNNMEGNLGYVNCTLGVHCRVGTRNGVVDTTSNPHIDLTGNNALLVCGDVAEVIE